MSERVSEEDLELLDRIEAGDLVFDQAEHEEALRKVAFVLLGEEVPVPSEAIARELRRTLRNLNMKTGDCQIAIEDASSREEVIILLIRFLAECGSPLRRRHMLAAATERLRHLER